MLKSAYAIPRLPPPGKLETEAVLREAARAHRALAEVKGRADAIPNQGILIDTLSLQEARASSEIENIITTQDEMFEASIFPNETTQGPAKEVALYRDALKCGWTMMGKSQWLLTNAIIIEMYRVLKRTTASFRETPGTALKNDVTGDIVYVPPQKRAEIEKHMTALERFMNDDADSAIDPLVRMAIIHHQFESIHPFSDGNGRIGRIVNVLFLARAGLLNVPILYLSRYITTHKSGYYRLLQSVRETGEWEEWILYMLRAVTETSRQTLELIEGVRVLMADYKHRIRANHPRLYSQDLLNNLFRHPYTRIEFLQTDIGKTRQTTSRYLDELASAGFVEKHSIGRNNYYVNRPLLDLFARVAAEKPSANQSRSRPS